MKTLPRFQFIGHALRGDGPFRPVISYDSNNKPYAGDYSYLIKYPRESTEKYARRVELAFYSSPLAKVTSRFVSHVSSKPVQRDIGHEMLDAIYMDTDGKGNNMDVFWQGFMIDAKSRGSMLLLVDMPRNLPDNMQSQLTQRAVPYWTPILPEQLTDYEIGDDGKFDLCEFSGTYTNQAGEQEECKWYFDREMWACKDSEDNTVEAGEHGLGECPVLIFAEMGDFPCYGPFAPIADLSKRLFNLNSELDEILRSQTFSLLTLQVPEGSTEEQKMEAAKTAGATIGTNNLMAHTGNSPNFIAPDSGPASTYLERIRDLQLEINELGLEVATPNQRESGISMQMRFQLINAELARFSARMESIEKRAWELSARWLGMNDTIPETAWPLDFNISDPEQELSILSDMQATAMPNEVIVEQQKRVVVTQFASMDMERQQGLMTTLENSMSEMGTTEEQSQ